MNPYALPKAPLAAAEPARGLTTAVLIGAAVANGVWYAVGYCYSQGWIWALFLQGVAIEALEVRYMESVAAISIAHVLGFACMMPGGYWAARLCTGHPYLSAVLAGGLFLVFTAMQFVLPYEMPVPNWSRALSLLLPIPAFLLGAWWRRAAERTRTP